MEENIRHKTKKRKKVNFNVDKLRLCFQQPTDLFSKLMAHNNIFYRVSDEISLRLIREELEEKIITAQIILHNEDDFIFGHFTFNDSKKYEGLCWLTLENKAFYRDYKSPGAYSFVYYINAISYQMSLIFNNITELEICCDTTFNYPYNVRKLIRDHEHYEMILHGKKIIDNRRRLDGYIECYSRSRDKTIPHPTIYIESAKKNDPKLRIYNKSLEIEDNYDAKSYIRQWNNFENQRINRAEIRLTNVDIKEAWREFTSNFPDDEQMKQPNGVVIMLDDCNFLRWLWYKYVNRIIRFIDKQTKKAFTLYDFISNEE